MTITNWTSTRRLVATLVLMLSSSLVASAHHGWGGYSDKEFEITGVVTTPLAMAGAHATMKVKSGDQVWNLTLAPPARTAAAGLKETTIPLGATVTVHGHRHVNPKNFEIKTERVTYNGKVFNVYPDRS